MQAKYSFKSFIILGILLFVQQCAWAQAIGKWINTGPVDFPVNASGQVNGLGRVSQIKFHPSKKDKMYAVSASGGLYISKDNGLTWNFTPGTETLPQTSCSAVCIDYNNDSTLYLSTGDADYYSNYYGIYKTTNAGATWTAVTSGIGTKMAVEILMDPADNKSLVAATSSGIWKTTDAAATWTQTKVGGAFKDMKARPKSKKTIYAANDTGFFISNDFGSTWTQIKSGISLPASNTGLRIGVTLADTNIVYLLTTKGNGVVFKSTDGGLNFTTVYNSSSQCLVCYDGSPTSGSQGNYDIDINVNPQNKNEVIVIAHAVWRSTDGGINWSQRTNWWLECHTDMHQIEWNPYDNTQIFNANDGGVWMSVDTTAKVWTPRCNGIAANEIYQAAQSPISRQVVSIGTQDNGELYYNSAWKTNRGGDWTSKCAFDYATASTVYYLGNGKRRSLVPMGAELSYNSPFTATNNSAIEFLPKMTNVCFLGKDSAWRSTNINAASPSWTMILAATDRIMDISSCRADSNILYIVTNNNKLLRSDNALAASPTFTTLVTPGATNVATSIITNKNDANVVFITCGAAIYRSANKGASWINITGTGLTGLNIRKVIHDDYSTNERLFVYAGNYLHSKNNTSTAWTNYTQNLPSVCSGKNLMIYNTGDAASILRISTYGRGVWECSINNDKKPIVDFTADKKNVCVGDTVRFYKTIYGTATSTSWSFPGGSPATSTLDSPVVVYTSKGLHTVTNISTGIGGADTTTKINYINVLDALTIPLVEGFEDTLYPPFSWQLQNASGAQWTQSTTVGAYGTSAKSIYFDNNSIDAGGKHDRIISPKMSLVGVSTARLFFDRAYQPYSATSYLDSLVLQVSLDCGKTWTPFYAKAGTALGTVATSATSSFFVPTATGWKTDTVSLAAYVGNEIMISFDNVGHYGQALYLDNINIQMSPATAFASNDTSICAGASATFYDSSLNASAWSWSFPGATPATGSTKTATVTYPTAGIYPVSLVASNGVGSTPLTKTSYVTVWANPIVTISSTGVSLIATCPTAITWQWYKNGIIITGATSATYTPTSMGNYTVSVADAHGCSATSPVHYFAPNGIANTMRTAGFELYPNPSKGKITLKGTAVNGKEITVYFLNVLGQQIATESIKVQQGNFVKEFDWSAFPKGVYEVRIVNDGKSVVNTKMILE